MQRKYQQLKAHSSQELMYIMKEEMELLEFLFSALSHRSRNSVKSILSRGQVRIDGRVETQYNYLIKQGEKVHIIKNKLAKRRDLLIGLSIKYEDKDLIVVEKDAGLLSVATATERELTAHRQLMNYVQSKRPNNRVFIVHRLDQETSGLLVFAKNERVKNKLQETWSKSVKERLYLALVEGQVNKRSGKITSWLKETKSHTVYSSRDKKNGRHAITHYQLIQGNQDYSLLEVSLQTGRKNQIRVHMQDIGHPVVGDKKYGATKNPINRLGLHAYVLTFIHPVSGKTLRFTSAAPQSFYNQSR